jgi:hypothetical protein
MRMTNHEPDPRLFQGLPCAGRAAANPGETGDPSRIRTCNPRSRNPLLYPVELWDRWGLHSIANMKNPLPGQAGPNPFPRQSDKPARGVDRCTRPALNAMLRRSRLSAGPRLASTNKARFDRQGSPRQCCMRLFRYLFPRHESVTFSRTSVHHAALDRAKGAPS